MNPEANEWGSMRTLERLKVNHGGLKLETMTHSQSVASWVCFFN